MGFGQPGVAPEANSATDTTMGDFFVPNADAGCRVLTPGIAACRMTCVFLLVRLGA
jgi:hypothetical protein